MVRRKSLQDPSTPGRIYRSSSTLHQLQFPSRRKKKGRVESQELQRNSASLRQQTLTQIYPTSGINEHLDDLTELSDSEAEDIYGTAPENNEAPLSRLSECTDIDGQSAREPQLQDGRNDVRPHGEVAERRSRGIPSQTSHDELRCDISRQHNFAKKRKRESISHGHSRLSGNRSSTETPLASNSSHSNYRTQTLTQFVDRRAYVSDSDGEEPGEGDLHNDEFLTWLRDDGNRESDLRHERHQIPETDAFQSNSHDAYFFESLNRQKDISNVCFGGSPVLSHTLGLSQDKRSHPSTPLRATNDPSICVIHKQAEPLNISPNHRPNSRTVEFQSDNEDGVLEIPDSDDDDGDDWHSSKADSHSDEKSPSEKNCNTTTVPGTSPMARSLLIRSPENSVSTSQQAGTPVMLGKCAVSKKVMGLHIVKRWVPAKKTLTHNEDHDSRNQKNRPGRSTGRVKCQSSVNLFTLNDNGPPESQRVPAQILQDLPPATMETDVVIVLPQNGLKGILDGSQDTIYLARKVFPQAVRFWFLNNSQLRYMACVKPGTLHGNNWCYEITRLFELNNSLSSEAMREEGWFDENGKRYYYIPPAVVGQLLWNLRRAVLPNGTDSRDSQDYDDHLPNFDFTSLLNLPASGEEQLKQHECPSKNLTEASGGLTNQNLTPDSTTILQGPSASLLSQTDIETGSQLLSTSQKLPDSLVCDASRAPPDSLE